jgi:hypothetical protein
MGEGIVIKNLDGKYESRRSNFWRKLKLWNETTIILQSYTENPAGIRCETADGIAIQVAGHNQTEVRKAINERGSCEVYIQYLTKTANGKYRFPSYRGVKNG